MTASKRHSVPSLDQLRQERCNEWLLREDWGPKCAGCGQPEYRIDGFCSIECRDYHCDYDLRDALEDVEDEYAARRRNLEEQYEALVRAARPFAEMAQEMLTGHPTGHLPPGAPEALLAALFPASDPEEQTDGG